MKNMSNGRRRAVSWLALPVMGASALIGLGTAVPAQGVVNTLVCTGTENVTWTPGLTNTPHPADVVVDGALPLCVHTGLQVTSGSYHEEFTQPSVSCTALLVNGTGTRTLHWNTGETSTFSFTRTVNRVAATIVVAHTGTITAGKFTGKTATETVVLPQLDALACDSTGGVTNAVGTAEVIIV